MRDEAYFRERAGAEARLAETSGKPAARAVHQAMHQAYLERANAIRRGGGTVR